MKIICHMESHTVTDKLYQDTIATVHTATTRTRRHGTTVLAPPICWVDFLVEPIWGSLMPAWPASCKADRVFPLKTSQSAPSLKMLSLYHPGFEVKVFVLGEEKNSRQSKIAKPQKRQKHYLALAKRTSNHLSTYPQKYPNQSETVKSQDPTGESKINNAIVKIC